MTTTNAAELFGRAQTKIRQAQARRDLLAQVRETVETLEAAAGGAVQRGDPENSGHLLRARDELKKKVLNPHLWPL